MKLFWYRYKCFSLGKAKSINAILLWLILPIAIITWFLMYVVIDAKDIEKQWYIYFILNSFQALFLAVITYISFKNTRHAGMSTAVLVYFIFKMLENAFNLSKKTPYIDTIWILLMSGLAFYIIYDYFKRAK